MARSFEHKVLAGAVGPNDGLDEILRRVLIVDKQLLGGLGKAHPGAVGGCYSGCRCAATGTRRR